MARLSSTLYGGLLSDGNVNQELVKQGWWSVFNNSLILDEVEAWARRENLK
jgi:hypothetical protein